MRQDYPLSSANIGTAFYFHDTARQGIYIRFWYRQSSPFNAGGSTSNDDQAKLIRAKLAGISGDPWALFIGNGPGANVGQLDFRFPDALPYDNYFPNLAAWNLNDHLGEWHSYEIHVDMSVSNALVYQLWVDGTLVADYSGANAIKGSTTASPEWYQFRGTTNSMQSPSSDWLDRVAFSTQRIGPQ